MVCPLRYIVAGVSIVIALLALVFLREEEDKRKASLQSYVQQSCGSGECGDDPVNGGEKSWTQSFVDLFTGRYLYEMYKEVSARRHERTNARRAHFREAWAKPIS